MVTGRHEPQMKPRRVRESQLPAAPFLNRALASGARFDGWATR